MRRVEKYLPPVLALILALMAVNSADVLSRWWHGYGTAITWLGVDVRPRTVSPGGDLHLIYSAIINRQCPSEIRGFLVAPDGSVPVRYPIISGGYTDAGEDPVSISVNLKIPMTSDPGLFALKTGVYIYRSLAIRFCSTGIETDSAIPDAEFFLEVNE